MLGCAEGTNRIVGCDKGPRLCLAICFQLADVGGCIDILWSSKGFVMLPSKSSHRELQCCWGWDVVSLLSFVEHGQGVTCVQRLPERELESCENMICGHFALVGFKCNCKKLCLLESHKLLLLC